MCGTASGTAKLVELQTLEKLNTQDDEQSRKTFLDNFDWSDTTLTLFERQKLEELLVEFHDIFPRHRFDIGIKNSKSNSHQTMTDQNIAKAFQPRSIKKTTSR